MFKFDRIFIMKRTATTNITITMHLDPYNKTK